MRMHLQNLLPAKACIIRSQPSIPMPPHFPVAAAGTMHAGSPNKVVLQKEQSRVAPRNTHPADIIK